MFLKFFHTLKQQPTYITNISTHVRIFTMTVIRLVDQGCLLRTFRTLVGFVIVNFVVELVVAFLLMANQTSFTFKALGGKE